MVLAGALNACGSGQDAEVEGVATDFHTAISDRDGDAACALLAPSTVTELESSAGKPCPQAVVEEKLPPASDPVSVDVFGTSGQVRFDSETTFLARYEQGWRVVAAGCTPRESHPYDCTLTGG